MLLLSCLMAVSLCLAQETLIKGGEQFRLDAIPQSIFVNMPVGEKRTITLDETLSNYCLWTARHLAAGSQTMITHNVYEAMGGLTAPMGKATVEFIGSTPIDCQIELLLAKPSDTQTPPLAVIRCHLIVFAVQKPVPPPAVIPLPPPPVPMRKTSIDNNQYFLIDEVPPTGDIKVRHDGGEIKFYLENRDERDFEWVALSSDKISVSIDNDVNIQAHIPGHKHKRDVHVSAIEITGFEPCDTRVILEYRRIRPRPGERPRKTMTISVKVR
ncbi:MAG: hypothetical protein J5833_02135 [Victivallales bacterium]|nr:hypothetical protein [Victivallales bacterium]